MAKERKWLANGLREGFRHEEYIVREPLPERWVDLVQYLNAQGREREEAARKKRVPDVPH